MPGHTNGAKSGKLGKPGKPGKPGKGQREQPERGDGANTGSSSATVSEELTEEAEVEMLRRRVVEEAPAVGTQLKRFV